MDSPCRPPRTPTTRQLAVHEECNGTRHWVVPRRTRLAPRGENESLQSHSFFKYDDEFAEHPDLVAMRRGVTDSFLNKFRAAFALYEEGRWAEAAEALRPAAAGAWRRDAKGRPVEDGPAKALLQYMEARAFEAPADWRGFRALTEK